MIKHTHLFINRDRSFNSPPAPLQGWSGKTYGMAAWDQTYMAHVARMEESAWSLEIAKDISRNAHRPLCFWIGVHEFECSDGTCFSNLSEALTHEATAPGKLVQSGIIVSRALVETASAERLRKIADAVGMPGFRRLTKADDLRPALATFLDQSETHQLAEAS